RPSGLPTEIDDCCPEQNIAYVTTGSLTGKFIYHQTSHTTTRGSARDYLYDPVTNAFTLLTSNGGGPDKLVYLTLDAGRNTIAAWSYGVGGGQQRRHGVIEGDLPTAQAPVTPSSLHIIK